MFVPRDWRTRQQRLSLRAALCQRCGAAVFPPRPLCADCAGYNVAPRSEASLGEAVVAAEPQTLPLPVLVLKDGTQAEGAGLPGLPEGPLTVLVRRLDGDDDEGQVLYRYE